MLCQGSISLAVLNWMPLDKYWLKKKNNKNISRVVIINECTWENIGMCNAFRKIGNNVINKRLTGLRSSCCFGDDLLQVQWFEGISVYRLTSDVWSYRCLHRLPKSASHAMRQQVHWEDGQVSVTCRRYAFDFQPDIKYCQKEFCCSCFGRERLNPPVFQFRIPTPLNSEQNWTATKRKAC